MHIYFGVGEPEDQETNWNALRAKLSEMDIQTDETRFGHINLDQEGEWEHLHVGDEIADHGTLAAVYYAPTLHAYFLCILGDDGNMAIMKVTETLVEVGVPHSH